MKQVDFFKLERNVQDRFLSACRGEFEPKPILFKAATRPTGWFWLAISPVALVALALLFQTGIGDMESSLARQSSLFLLFYVGLVVAFAVGIVQFIAHRAASSALPFVPGFYLFPACLVDARGTVLGVQPISEVTSANLVGGEIIVMLGGKTMRFPADKAYGEQALSAIKLAQMQCSDELAAAARVMLDPLAPPVVDAPFAPDKALVERRPLWMKIRFVAAAAVGVIGVIVYQQRDDLSDARMFATAKDKDDIATYKRYLERGTDHQGEVARVLLPQAELRVAVAKGTVEAIDDFKKTYPDTDIGPAIDQARRRALEAAFNEAAKPATLDALLAFDEKYPGHHLAKHLQAHRHAIYMRALDGYKAKMPKTARTADFAGRLVAYSEKSGPIKTPEGVRGVVAEVRIRAVPSKALKKSDELIKKNQYFVGPKSLPSRYFEREKVAETEKRVVQSYADALAKAFPSSILRFQVGPEVDGSEDELPKVDKPTLIVSYRVEPSGKNYASAKPRGIYVGLVLFFRVDFLLPSDDKPHHTDLVVPRNVPGKMVVAHSKNPEGAVEPKLYERMTNDAFDKLFTHYMSEWLRPELLKK